MYYMMSLHVCILMYERERERGRGRVEREKGGGGGEREGEGERLSKQAEAKKLMREQHT